jgi:iron complex transport system ATP-binding protein
MAEKRMFHVPGLPEQAEAQKKKLPPDADRILLSAENLSIGWGKGKRRKSLTSGISLAVRGGRLVALIGPNGSGKSTLLRTISGLQESLAGKIELMGAPMRGLDADERARKVACVFNERFDTGYFTVFDIVAFGRYPYTDARNSLTEADAVLVGSALDAVGMGAFTARRFGELSDGEKQKVQIARAIAQNTSIIVLDEPTAFLDAPSRIEIFHLATRLVVEKNMSIVLCTHEVDLALRNSDELWVMDREHRFESGTPASIARSGVINRAFDTENIRFDPIVNAFRARA